MRKGRTASAASASTGQLTNRPAAPAASAPCDSAQQLTAFSIEYLRFHMRSHSEAPLALLELLESDTTAGVFWRGSFGLLR